MRDIKLKRTRLIVAGAFLLVLFSIRPGWSQIEKCQDAEGKWHYGDNAAAVCRESKITVLDKSGIKIKEIDRPPTREEIEAREAERKRREAEEVEKREREQARARILRVYPDEKSIYRARDGRLEGIEKSIKLNEQLLDELRLEKQKLKKAGMPGNEKARARYNRRLQEIEQDMERYTASISRLRADRERVSKKYKMILEEYRDLTGNGPEKGDDGDPDGPRGH